MKSLERAEGLALCLPVHKGAHRVSLQTQGAGRSEGRLAARHLFTQR
jgi:hypothetical protein